MPIDTIQSSITNIKINIENQKLSKLKKDTLKLLQEYPLTYKEFEEYINYLIQIKDESTLLVQNNNYEAVITNNCEMPLRTKVSLNSDKKFKDSTIVEYV